VHDIDSSAALQLFLAFEGFESLFFVFDGEVENGRGVAVAALAAVLRGGAAGEFFEGTGE